MSENGEKDVLRRLAHDLRSPLNTIIGFAAIIRDGHAGPITEKQQRFLDDIMSGARELEALIAAAQIEAEKGTE